ncbi:hypothetical protein EDB84DRAFT_1441694 [Lactarius hengduanensis]|nr:hypothetical protein EDB84DRAFT_1441694 [Lactarius hengduanensis]
MTPHSTPATLTSPDPSIGAVSLQHNADLPETSDTPDFSSSVSHNPVIDTVIPTGSISAPDLAAAAEGDGTVRAALQTETDALYSPSVIRQNTISTQELPSQLPSLPSVADVAFAGPSRRSLDVERTGDPHSHPSHGQHDIV